MNIKISEQDIKDCKEAEEIMETDKEFIVNDRYRYLVARLAFKIMVRVAAREQML